MFIFSSKMFGCPCQLVTVDRPRYWIHMFVFPHFIMAAKYYAIVMWSSGRKNNCISPLCTCGLDIESTVYFFLQCNYYNSARISLWNDLNSVDRTLLNLSDLSLVNVLFCGGPQFDDSQNAFILNSSIKYILISEKFSGCLF